MTIYILEVKRKNSWEFDRILGNDRNWQYLLSARLPKSLHHNYRVVEYKKTKVVKVKDLR